MGLLKVKLATFRRFSRAAGCGALLAAGLLLHRGQLPAGFLLAFLALSAIAVAESDIDFTAGLNRRSCASMLTARSQISTLGKLCDIAAYFCLAAAVISWVAAR
ncbi:MAG TPA: hypothetical protein VMH77_01465 [Steroidobacteraceae bacterium]|nr:hypothetical protein [Steroidobacteraceae bacterium]